MSRNGSGVYSLPAGNPVVTNTTISTTWANTTLTDLATAMTGSVAADGQTPITGNLNLNNNKITSLADGTLSADATTLSQVTTAIAAAVATINAQISAINAVKTGSIQMWSTGTAPTGYLLCAGSAVSRSTYSALFAVIGTTFGVGDGSTTFNVPNYTNRMPYGTTLAATGGSADAIVVTHNHTATVTDAGHNHNFNGGANASPQNGFFAASGAVANGDGGLISASSVVTNTTGITVANTSAGSSGTNANLPPYLGINFIIKT